MQRRARRLATHGEQLEEGVLEHLPLLVLIGDHGNVHLTEVLGEEEDQTHCAVRRKGIKHRREKKKSKDKTKTFVLTRARTSRRRLLRGISCGSGVFGSFLIEKISVYYPLTSFSFGLCARAEFKQYFHRFSHTALRPAGPTSPPAEAFPGMCLGNCT